MMAQPNESTIYCDKCTSFNIGVDCCICKICTEKIIDNWTDECDKLLETSDINKLKELFGICTEDDIICRTPTEEFLKLEKENGVCTNGD